MDNRIKQTLSGLAAALLLAPSCSVKEERGECPVYVTVLTERFIQNGYSDGIVSFHAAEPIDREKISFLSYIGKGFRQACPRDYARAAVLSGLEYERIDATTLYVPYGRQAGRVWSYGETFSAQEDEYRIEAVPHKQYCLVKFLFGDSAQAPSDYPWRFRIRAACNGMNIYTAEPLEGEYCCLVEPDAAGEWTSFSIDDGEQLAVEAVNLLRGGFRPAESLAALPALPPASDSLQPGSRSKSWTGRVMILTGV